MAWYNIGTVSVTNGNAAVVGSGTLWASQVAAGDIFTVDGLTLYSIQSVTNDTHLTLTTNFMGTTSASRSYAIERAGQTITLQPQTAQDIAAFVSKWNLTLNELLSWLTASGITTLTNPGTGISVSVKTPTQIEADFAAAQTGITASQTAAAASATTAQAQVALATTQASNASASATTAAANAATSTAQAGTATTQAGNASTSATNAAASASTATTQATNATTQATNAANSATAAANSATAAQSSATGANTSALSATASATTASTAATTASSAATTASTAATTASSAASSATMSANSATTSQGAAANSATNAANSATAAAGSATTATTQASNAASSATAAAASASTATTQAGNAAASANNAATAVVSQLNSIKTQTETARDQALAGLGAADNSQILSNLLGDSGYLIDMVGQAIKEMYRYEGVTDPRLVALEPGMDNIVQTIVNLADLLGVTARAVSGGDIIVRLGSVDNPSISINGDRNTGMYSPGADQLALTTAGVQRLLVDASGNHLTGTDNAQTLGSAAKRWSTVYAGTGTINTSDAREKTAVAPLTADELSAAKDLSREIGTYQFLASIEDKGTAARRHAGLTVQRAIEIMQAHKLDPLRYGFICHDAWPEASIDHPAMEAVPEVLDADGNIIEMGRMAIPAWTEIVQTAGDRYSFRYDQLNLFIAAGLHARLAALEPI